MLFVEFFMASYSANRFVMHRLIAVLFNCSFFGANAASKSLSFIINAIVIAEIFIAMGGEFGQGQRYSAGVTQEELKYWLIS